MGQIWEAITKWFGGLSPKTQDKFKKAGIFILVIIVIMILSWLFPPNISVFDEAEASERHHHTKIYNTFIESNGAALAIAQAQHHFDWSTDRLQAGIGFGHFDGENAVSASVAQRQGDVLVNISIGHEGDDTGLGLGFNRRF